MISFSNLMKTLNTHGIVQDCRYLCCTMSVVLVCCTMFDARPLVLGVVRKVDYSLLGFDSCDVSVL